MEKNSGKTGELVQYLEDLENAESKKWGEPTLFAPIIANTYNKIIALWTLREKNTDITKNDSYQLSPIPNMSFFCPSTIDDNTGVISLAANGGTEHVYNHFDVFVDDENKSSTPPSAPTHNEVPNNKVNRVPTQPATDAIYNSANPPNNTPPPYEEGTTSLFQKVPSKIL